MKQCELVVVADDLAKIGTLSTQPLTLHDQFLVIVYIFMTHFSSIKLDLSEMFNMFKRYHGVRFPAT